MVRGGGRGEQQGIRPQDLEDRAPLDPVALPKRDVGPLATEQERGLAAWIAVRPLLKNLVVIDDEAVLVPDSVKDQVYLKTRRILLLAGIQAERAARHPGLRVAVAERVQHVPAHVAHGAQHVALPRGIRPEDASGGEHLDGAAALVPRYRARHALVGKGHREHRQFQPVPERAHVLSPERQQPRNTHGGLIIGHEAVHYGKSSIQQPTLSFGQAQTGYSLGCSHVTSRCARAPRRSGTCTPTLAETSGPRRFGAIAALTGGI